MRTAEKYHENAGFALSDWKTFMNLMKAHLIDRENGDDDSVGSENSDLEEDGEEENSGPVLQDTFKAKDSNEQVQIDKVHEIMSAFDGKDGIDLIQLLKETMASLLKNASPKVYKHRFTSEMFVRIALAFYMDGGSSCIKEMLFCGDDEAEKEGKEE